MSHTLEQFATACHRTLKADPGPAGREQVCALLQEMLKDEQFVLFKPGYGLRRVVLEACASAGFSPTIAFETSQRETIYGMVQEGLGITLLPRSGIHFGEYTWRLVLLEPRNVTRELSLAWKGTRRHSDAARAFREFLLAQFE